jgi:hypothetical protein
MHKTIVVLTYKSLEQMLAVGGTLSWHLNRSKARQYEFVVCTRNAHHKKSEGAEPHKSGFLIGKIKEIVQSPNPDMPDRWLIQFDTYAKLDIPNLWGGERNPVRYSSLEKLGIDSSKLKWESALSSKDAPTSLDSVQERPFDRNLTIEDAKKGLAITFGVAPEAIEITIRA